MNDGNRASLLLNLRVPLAKCRCWKRWSLFRGIRSWVSQPGMIVPVTVNIPILLHFAEALQFPYTPTRVESSHCHQSISFGMLEATYSLTSQPQTLDLIVLALAYI